MRLILEVYDILLRAVLWFLAGSFVVMLLAMSWFGLIWQVRSGKATGNLQVTCLGKTWHTHYNDVIMGTMTSQITSLTIVYSTVYLGADQRKLQRSVSLAFVLGIRWWPVNSLHKGPVTWKMFPFDCVIMWPGERLSTRETNIEKCWGSETSR